MVKESSGSFSATSGQQNKKADTLSGKESCQKTLATMSGRMNLWESLEINIHLRATTPTDPHICQVCQGGAESDVRAKQRKGVTSRLRQAYANRPVASNGYVFFPQRRFRCKVFSLCMMFTDRTTACIQTERGRVFSSKKTDVLSGSLDWTCHLSLQVTEQGPDLHLKPAKAIMTASPSAQHMCFEPRVLEG